MGSILRLLGYPNKGRTDSPNPAIELTSDERSLVEDSFKEKISKYPIQSGVDLFISYFKKFPEDLIPFQSKFDINITDTEKLSQDEKFRTYCEKVIKAISSDLVGYPDFFAPIFELSLGSLLPMGLKEKHFVDMKTTILERFEEIMTPEEVEAWKKVLDIFFSKISDDLKREREHVLLSFRPFLIPIFIVFIVIIIHNFM